MLDHLQMIHFVKRLVKRKNGTGSLHAIPSHFQFVHGVYIRNMEFNGWSTGNHEMLLGDIFGRVVIGYGGGVGVGGTSEPEVAVLASLAGFEEEDRVAAADFGDFVHGGAVSSAGSAARARVIFACDKES